MTTLGEFEGLFLRCSSAFKQTRTLLRAKDLAFGVINCVGRQTITGLLSSCGKLFEDWSADYRLFQQNRMDVDKMFDVVRKELINNHLPSDQPIYAHMDDTLLKKTGKKITGTAWRRDPLGPPFHTNFIWGQRFIQLSISLPQNQGPSPARSIPVDLFHSPTAKKPRRNEGQAAWDDYKERQKQARLSQKGVERIKALREKLDQDGAENRQLIVSVDGSYSNETVLKNLPKSTTLTGRIRKDTLLHQLPEENTTGRKRIYGQTIPTPEQIRQSDDYSWQKVIAYASGKSHSFSVKVIRNVRWKKAGNQNLQLVVIRPLSYRLTKNARLLYRRPAYLICTDPDLDIDKLLQAYLWRWGIEVNFKEEKTLLGCGKAQVRTHPAVEKVPAFITVVYAMLLIAAHKVAQQKKQYQIPRSKWYPNKKDRPPTTGDTINTIRSQIFAKSLNISFTHFVNLQQQMRTGKIKPEPHQASLFYCRK